MSRREGLDESGKWVTAARERARLSVRELATRLGVSTPTIYDWQNGVTAISEERAKQLAEVLGLDLIEVRRGVGLWVDDRPESSEPADSASIDADLSERIDTLFELAANLMEEANELKKLHGHPDERQRRDVG